MFLGDLSRMLGAAVALVATSLGTASAVAAPVVLATQAKPTRVAAYRSTVAWSEYDATSKRFRLVQQDGSAPPMRLGAPSRAIPFDVDLGPGPAGRTVAVYSRCQTERAAFVDDPAFLPLWEEERGCRLYVLDLLTGRERRVAQERATPGDSDFLPSIWGHRLAFVREHVARDTAPGNEGRERLLLLDLSTGRTRRLQGGPRGVGHAGGDPLYPRGPGAMDLDLRGSRLAYRWGFYANHECHGADPELRGDPFVSDLRVAKAGQGSRTLDSACAERDPSLLVGPTQTAGSIFYAKTMLYTSDRGDSSLLASGPHGQTTREPLDLGQRQAFIVSMAASGTNLFFATYDQDGPGGTAHVIALPRAGR